MKIKTSELSGVALDWAVAKCEGVKIRCILPMHGTIHIIGRDNYLPSHDWSIAGPIIEREIIGIEQYKSTNKWSAFMLDKGFCEIACDTPLIAAMRCYVASKLGEEIDVPDELIES